MPRGKKNAVEPTVKATEVTKAEAIETKTEDIKAEETVAASKAAEETAAKPKKTPAKTKSTKAAKEAEAESAKAEAVTEEPVTKETVKEEPAKEEAPKKGTAKAPASKTKDEAQKTTLHIQYGGKSIAEEDLIKSAKDIWKYDLKRKISELTSIELYVKPEDNAVYYVMNEDVKGSFPI